MSIVTRVVGFNNLGNTCYMNASLQALLSSNVINTAILLYLKKVPDSVNKFTPLFLAYCRMIVDLTKKDTQLTYNPSFFKAVIDRAGKFKGHCQHDSHEFITYLVDNFADEKNDKGITNIMRKLCFGKCKEILCCDECMRIDEKFTNFLDVTLSIPNNKEPDLEQCFKKFAVCESLSEDNKWFCPTCKKKVIAHKKIEIHEVPEVAIFTFKRFIATPKGTTKITTPVKIYEAIELEGKKLKLIATINHYGNLNGGHYVANISRGDDWYRVDDSRTSKINVKSLLNDPSVYTTIYQVDC